MVDKQAQEERRVVLRRRYEEAFGVVKAAGVASAINKINVKILDDALKHFGIKPLGRKAAKVDQLVAKIESGEQGGADVEVVDVGSDEGGEKGGEEGGEGREGESGVEGGEGIDMSGVLEHMGLEMDWE